MKQHAATIVAGIIGTPAERDALPDPDALGREVFRQLDMALHPYGDVGQIPTEPGEYYYVVWRNGRAVAGPWQATFDEDDWHDVQGGPFHPELDPLRFRHRWTPEGPVTP